MSAPAGEDGTSFSVTLVVDYCGNDEESNDFYIDFVDKVEGHSSIVNDATGKVDETGNMKANRIQIIVGENIKNTGINGAHELGHTGGLYEPDKYTHLDEYYKPVESDNIMFKQPYSSDQNCRSVSTFQLSRISNNYEKRLGEPPTLKTVKPRNTIIPLDTKKIKL